MLLIATLYNGFNSMFLFVGVKKVYIYIIYINNENIYKYIYMCINTFFIFQGYSDKRENNERSG